MCGGEGGGPGGEEDVVFKIWGHQVADGRGADGFADCGGECDGREDGEGAGVKFDFVC